MTRCLLIAAILTDAIGCEIVLSAPREAGLRTQLYAMRPLSGSAFAAPVFLERVANEIVVALPFQSCDLVHRFRLPCCSCTSVSRNSRKPHARLRRELRGKRPSGDSRSEM